MKRSRFTDEQIVGVLMSDNHVMMSWKFPLVTWRARSADSTVCSTMIAS